MKSAEPSPDEPDLLAAEYVLGTLDRDGRDELERRRRSDTAVQRAIRDWEARLDPLALRVAPVVPSGNVDRRILAAVHERAADQGATADARPGDNRGGPPDEIAAARDRQAALQRRLGTWRALAIAASLAALGLGALLAANLIGIVPGTARTADTVEPIAATSDVGATGSGESTTIPDANATASDASATAPTASTSTTDAAERTALSLLRDADGAPRYLVEIGDDDSVRITALDRGEASSDSSLQLWMADGASGELRPVGLLPRDAWSSVQLADVPLFEDEPAFAVSVEPAGGSPEAGPTGEVVFTGTIHPVESVR